MSARLDELDTMVLAHLEHQVEAATSALARYKAKCGSCRQLIKEPSFPMGHVDVNDRALGLQRRGEEYYCASCGRCVLSLES